MRRGYVLFAVGLAAGVIAAVTVQAQQRRATPPTLTALDYIQIQQLVAHYSYALDTGADDGYMYADLFAPDGVMHSGGRDYKGREDLARLVRINPNPSGVGRDGQPVDNTFPSPGMDFNPRSRGPAKVSHFLTNHLIDPSPEGATGKEYLAIVDLSENGKPGVVHQGGHYEDVYVKTPQGWRFKSRQMIRSKSGPQSPQAEPTR
jgi:actinorhodin biosynthesis protein ActVIA